MLLPKMEYKVNHIKVGQEYLQLLMRIHCRLPNGRTRKLRVLVDTGAQVNLIREGLVPYVCTQLAIKPVRLMAANQLPLPGGGRCTTVDLSFVQVIDRNILPEKFVCPAEFYEAQIDVDAILSYPWLREHKIGVYPHLCALTKMKPRHTLLYGSIRDWEVQGDAVSGGRATTSKPPHSGEPNSPNVTSVG